jgi:hypothetical protein
MLTHALYIHGKSIDFSKGKGGQAEIGEGRGRKGKGSYLACLCNAKDLDDGNLPEPLTTRREARGELVESLERRGRDRMDVRQSAFKQRRRELDARRRGRRFGVRFGMRRRRGVHGGTDVGRESIELASK